LTSAPAESIAGESCSHWRRGEGIESLSRHGADDISQDLQYTSPFEPCSLRALTCLVRKRETT
jgi:hypothetical protein